MSWTYEGHTVTDAQLRLLEELAKPGARLDLTDLDGRKRATVDVLDGRGWITCGAVEGRITPQGEKVLKAYRGQAAAPATKPKIEVPYPPAPADQVVPASAEPDPQPRVRAKPEALEARGSRSKLALEALLAASDELRADLVAIDRAVAVLERRARA